MKFKLYKSALLILTGFVIFSSCADRLEDINVDEKTITKKDLEGDYQTVGALLPFMMQNIYKIDPGWFQQVSQNLNADHFSGYMMSANNFGKDCNATYKVRGGWNVWITRQYYPVLNTFIDVKRDGLEDFPDLYSIGLILNVWAGHRLVDIYGPVPYSQFGTGSSVEYDDEDVAYNKFFADLDEAIKTLTEIENNDPEFDARFKLNDRSTFEGDYKKWVQMANTLRLRLAIRIAEVAPTLAEQQAIAATSHEFGLLDENSGSFFITHSFNHPLYVIAHLYEDIQMGSDAESILVGFDDPRLPEMFVAATDPVVEGEFKGIRQGIVTDDDRGVYENFSRPNYFDSEPVLLMPLAESYFLQAEAVLRTWSINTSQTVEQLYEAGVKASFDDYGLNAADLATYLASSNTPIDYVDPKNAANNFSTTITITPQWNDVADFEEKLERIITQKWIALYPDGQEAWSEFRRTGYPKLTPIPPNVYNTKIPQGEFIKRVPYDPDMYNNNPTATANAVDSRFGGDDNPNSRLWWDVD